MSKTFSQMDLSIKTMKALEKCGYETPMPVQEEAIVPMSNQEDLLVQAPTGTGKTLAFCIPLIEKIDWHNKATQCVVLCPTRELALQTAEVVKNLCAYQQSIRSITLYGGVPIGRQIAALRRKPQIVIATPGRLMDHLRRRTLRLDQVHTVVLDEADRMLDMGFRDDIEFIIQQVPSERQTVMFSATYTNEIKKIASTYQKNVKHITIQPPLSNKKAVKQHYSIIKKNAKLQALLQLFQQNQFKRSIVFVSTKLMADQLSTSLGESGYHSGAIHGNLNQRQRDTVMRQYREGRIGILVATDVAARGIDVDQIDVVINFDIPEDPDSYTHRIGRTGRAGHRGISHTLLYAREQGKLNKIMDGTKTNIVNYPIEAFAPRKFEVEQQKTAGRPRQNKQRRNKYRDNNNRQRIA